MTENTMTEDAPSPNPWVFIPHHWQRIWLEDDCAPDRECVEEAWERFFGEPYQGHPPAHHPVDDHGDCAYILFPKGRVVCSAYDGCSIYIVSAGQRFEPDWRPEHDT